MSDLELRSSHAVADNNFCWLRASRLTFSQMRFLFACEATYINIVIQLVSDALRSRWVHQGFFLFSFFKTETQIPAVFDLHPLGSRADNPSVMGFSRSPFTLSSLFISKSAFLPQCEKFQVNSSILIIVILPLLIITRSFFRLQSLKKLKETKCRGGYL